MEHPLLDRLERVHSGSAPGIYTALCPGHQDKNPSLSVALLDDGRVLIHCHAGCEPIAVVTAVGLCLGDLFPERDKKDQRLQPMWWAQKERKEAAKKEEKLQHARLVLAMAEGDRQAGRTLSRHDLETEAAAFRDLQEA